MNDGRDNLDSALAGVEKLRRENAELRALLGRIAKAYDAAPDDFGTTYEYDEMDALRTVLDDCAALLKGAAVPVAGEAVAFGVGDRVRVTGATLVPHSFVADEECTVVLLTGPGDEHATEDWRRSIFIRSVDRALTQWVHPRDLVLVRKASGHDE